MTRRTGRILVVEDDASIGSVLDDLLSEEGYEVDWVQDGVSALAHVEQRVPDLVLLDLMLPDLDGFELCRRLREREDGRRLPVLMLTALSDPRDTVRGIISGADDYITKPFDFSVLTARLELRLSQVRREREQLQAAVDTGLEAIGHAIAAPDTVADLVRRVVDLARAVLDSSSCGIMLWNAREEAFEAAGCVGLDDTRRALFHALRVPVSVSEAVEALVRQHTSFTLYSDSQNPLTHAVMKAFDRDVVRAAPMLNEGTLYGMLLIGRSGLAHNFTESEAAIIDALASQSALAIARRRAIEDLERKAFTDELTGLYNIRYLHQFLEQQLARASRTGEPTSLLMLDLDHFKQVNDRYGHPAGDAVLVVVARAIAASIRTADIAVRYGGEEFVVVLPGASRAQALAVGRRVLQAVRRLCVPIDGTKLRVTISGGAATTSAARSLAESLIAAADEALYAAKDAGRDRIL